MPQVRRPGRGIPATVFSLAAVWLACLGAAVALPPVAAAARVEPFFGREVLPFPWVTGIFADGEDVWVATRGGTRIYNVSGKSWRAPDRIDGHRVTGLARFRGDLYVATESSLNVRTADGWRSYPRIAGAHAANAVLLVSGEILFLAARTMTGGLLEYDGTAWRILSRGPGTGVMNNVTAIAARDGELWAGTTNSGIYRRNPEGWGVFGPEDGIPSLTVTSVAGAGKTMYAGTPDGLAVFVDNTWKTFRNTEGLPGNKIRVLKVYMNKVFAGTSDRGISVFDGHRFENVSRADGLSDDRVEAIEVVGDTVWVGTVNGLTLIGGLL